jgi:hypothetical protein
MAKIYVKCVEPCIYDDQAGNVVDMSKTEFNGNPRWQGIDPVTGEDISKPRKANPDKVFEVVDSKYWLQLITAKKLVQVEKPRPRRAKEDTDDQKTD